jgi:hypothetical protein
MPNTTPTTTGTTRDVPVVPDSRVRYEQLAPEGVPHTVYRVLATKPVARP